MVPNETHIQANSIDPLRVFFAISAEEALEEFDPFLKKLQHHYVHYPLRWHLPIHLHVTLKFIERLDPLALDALLVEVQKSLENIKSFEIYFQKLYLFPRDDNPRVIALDVHPQGELMVLSHTIAQAMRRLKLPVDDRPFKAHMTLARFKNQHPLQLAQPRKMIYKKVPVKEIILYESKPTAEGSHYNKLASLPLGE